MLPASDFIFKKMMLIAILRNFKFQKLMDFNFSVQFFVLV